MPRVFRWGTVMSALFLLSGGVPSNGSAKELPKQVTVEELSAEPERYDGERVFVIGRVQKIEGLRGRRGGLFVMILLEGAAEDDSGRRYSVGVFSLPPPPRVRLGDRAIIQGVYHQSARKAGRPLEHFIDAEAILRD